MAYQQPQYASHPGGTPQFYSQGPQQPPQHNGFAPQNQGQPPMPGGYPGFPSQPGQQPPQAVQNGFPSHQPPVPNGNGYPPQLQQNSYGQPPAQGFAPGPVKPLASAPQIPAPTPGFSKVPAPSPFPGQSQPQYGAPQVPTNPSPSPYPQAQSYGAAAPSAQPPQNTQPGPPSGFPPGPSFTPQPPSVPQTPDVGQNPPRLSAPSLSGPQQGAINQAGQYGAPSGFPPGPATSNGPTAPSGFPPGPASSSDLPHGPAASNGFPPNQPAPSSFTPGPAPPNGPTAPVGFAPGPTPPSGFPPSSQAPSVFTPGPQGPTGYPPGPGAPGGFPPGPQAPSGFPPGPQVPSGFPPGPQAPSGFPPGPQAPSGFPSGPQAPSGFPPGPQAPGGYPGSQAPAGFPPGPQAPGGFPSGPGFPPGPGGFAPGPGQPGAAPGYPGPPQQQRAPQRLDPNLMPSAVQVIEDDRVREGLFPTGYPHAEPPPLVSTQIFSQDQGNCNPKFMRSTMYIAPQTNDLLKTSQIPFALSIAPFAALTENERPPPVVDLGPQGPIRCQRCKAYICPFMEFQDGGRRFRCPFCHASTPVEDSYFAHLDHTGRRTDIEMRPELFLGAYEFVATKQYCKNGLPPKEPAFIFMVDVSYNAMSCGLVQILCQNLERILQALPKELGQPESSIRIGLATFDQVIHFFDLSSAQPKMLVMNDIQEPFVPLVDGLLLPYSEALNGLRTALAEIPRIFAPSRTTETILFPVVQAGVDALKCADRAGKLLLFTTSIPAFEAPGKLKSKNERNLLGTDKEKTALVPQDETYTKLGETCVKNGVTVDLFLFPNAFIDVATIGQLSAVTGGSVFKYQYFSGEKDGIRLLNELQQHVSKKIGFDCMVRVRSSAGIRPVTFYGSFFMENATDLEIASLDESKSFFAELKYDDKLSDPSAVIQTAVLYTSTTGQRRLRILNLCLPVSNDYNQLYRVADPDALTSLLLKQAVQINREKGNKEMRDHLAQKCAQILATYREKCSESAPLGQLILPETLKLMPLYINSIIKNDAISGGSEMTVDDKVWQMELIRAIRVEDAMPLIYPRIYPVSDLQIQEPSELTALPAPIRASSEYLENSKAFVIDNGVVLFLWIGLGVPADWVRDVFGVDSVAMINPESHVIPEKDNARSRALRRLIQLLPKAIRTRRTFVICEKSALEPWMKKFLVEDKASPTSMSYVDFLCYIHREIRNLLS
ncbi:unnamed protein product [Caenorhabditis auriculariae]|uniref:Uncharacterized protein n=1 Tax=Caenorhabditis auriculariae TaxID=2777116 RepID=A0A8S1H7M1_9PELO|nr:unnamed protein product [Caenorhabditis auriculariae]